MDRRISDVEMFALDNLKFIYEDDYWRLYEEKNNKRLWARRKEKLTTVIPVDFSEPRKSKKNYKL